MLHRQAARLPLPLLLLLLLHLKERRGRMDSSRGAASSSRSPVLHGHLMELKTRLEAADSVK